jgi:hypothetical protein
MATLRKVFLVLISAVAGFTAQEVLAVEHLLHSEPLVQETTISLHEHTSNAVSIQTRKEAVRALVDLLGAEKSDGLLNAMDLPPTGDTHLLGHEVGEMLYSKHGIDGLRQCSPSFLMACYHGLVIRAVGNEGERDLGTIFEVCQSDRNVLSQCAHAVGHGLLAWTGYDVPKTLTMCTQVSEEVRYHCFDGVFMEHVYHVFTPRSVLAEASLKNPHDLCQSMEHGYQRACYANQPPYWFAQYGGDLKRVGAACGEVADSTNRAACDDGYARLTYTMANGDPGKANGFCQILGESRTDACYLSMVLASSSYRSDSAHFAQTMCASVRDPAMGQYCADAVGSRDTVPSGSASNRQMDFEGSLAGFLDFDVEKQRTILKAVAVLGGPTRALEALSLAYQKNPWKSHDLAHYIGEVAYELLGLEGLRQCTSVGSFGCHHGLVAAHVNAVGDHGVTSAVDSCLKSSTDMAVQSCIHGIGHATYASKGGTVLAALESCDTVVTSTGKEICYGGVFHTHNMSVASESGITCRDMPVRYQSACLYQKPAAILNNAKGDFAAAAKACRAVQDDTLQAACFRGIGTQAALSAEGAASKIVELCHHMGLERGTELCLIQSARELVFVGRVPEGRNLCSELSSAVSGRCHDEVQQVLAQLHDTNTRSRQHVVQADRNPMLMEVQYYSSPYQSPYLSPYSSPYPTPYGNPYQTPYQYPYQMPHEKKPWDEYRK